MLETETFSFFPQLKRRRFIQIQAIPVIGGGVKYFWFLSRKLRKIPILTNIFRMGWFNPHPKFGGKKIPICRAGLKLVIFLCFEKEVADMAPIHFRKQPATDGTICRILAAWFRAKSTLPETNIVPLEDSEIPNLEFSSIFRVFAVGFLEVFSTQKKSGYHFDDESEDEVGLPMAKWSQGWELEGSHPMRCRKFGKWFFDGRVKLGTYHSWRKHATLFGIFGNDGLSKCMIGHHLDVGNKIPTLVPILWHACLPVRMENCSQM